MEWSAPAGSATDDVDVWRQASPHWAPRRHRLIAKRHEAMLAGEVEDPEEPDPEQSFRAQWLNQWPRKPADAGGPTEPLLPDGAWANLQQPELEGEGPVWVAVEDDYGCGAAVACARRVEDGRLELDGWLTEDWDSAILDVDALTAGYDVRRLLVGASLLDRVPAGLAAVAERRGTAEVRTGLALIRDLALTRQVVHDETSGQLDDALGAARVRESSAGLMLVAGGSGHLVRAAVWALAEAHRPAKIPAVH